MKAIIVFAFAIVALFSFSSSSFGQGAMQILTEFENKKIDAVKKYIENNPKAPDLDTAFVIMERAHFTLGEMEPMLDILDKRYSMMPKGEKANLDVLTEVARDYIEICVSLDEKERGKKFAQKVVKDMAPHPAAEGIADFVNNVAADLYLPTVGDSLDLKFTAVDGKEFDLSKLKGKAVLIDFWATWCPPCIREMPNVIGVYNLYREKGFEVVGISLDEDLKALEEFTSASGIVWPQYFDGKGWQNELARKFGIKGVPATFLIGKDGKIIAANLRGAELEEAVKKELGIE